MKIRIANVKGDNDKKIFDMVDGSTSQYMASDDDTRRDLFTLSATYEGNDVYTMALTGFNMKKKSNLDGLTHLLGQIVEHGFTVNKIYA